MFSLFTAIAVSGTAWSVSVIPIPPAPASEILTTQVSPVTVDPQPLTHRSYYLLAGDTDTFAPLKAELPTGTTLMLNEGATLEAFRDNGWSISVADNVLSVTAPRSAEGNYQIPVVITYPDQSTQAVSVTIFVDYLVDINLSSLAPRWPMFQSSSAP